jgi:hypothetical protein
LVKTRLSRCAQVIARDGMYAGFSGAKTGHRRMTPNWRLFALAICVFGLATLAPLRRGHQRTVFAVRGKYTVKPRQVDSRLAHQCGQLGNDVQGCTNAAGAWMRRSGEIHRLDKIAGSDFEQLKAGPKGGGQDARSNMT